MPEVSCVSAPFSIWPPGACAGVGGGENESSRHNSRNVVTACSIDRPLNQLFPTREAYGWISIVRSCGSLLCEARRQRIDKPGCPTQITVSALQSPDAPIHCWLRRCMYRQNSGGCSLNSPLPMSSVACAIAFPPSSVVKPAASRNAGRESLPAAPRAAVHQAAGARDSENAATVSFSPSARSGMRTFTGGTAGRFATSAGNIR
ncbi:Uncharacterised protein [Citrobacter koseri]|uniref:Uncharacterized protein n=1 Tax=Citrobacter koseri TaxID=545 RepID=A0A2X2VCH6_CITKO|nr:Uncharacterised protein [Citrobacter koseri]